MVNCFIGCSLLSASPKLNNSGRWYDNRGLSDCKQRLDGIGPSRGSWPDRLSRFDCLKLLVFIIIVAFKLAYQFHNHLDGVLAPFGDLLQVAVISFF